MDFPRLDGANHGILTPGNGPLGQAMRLATTGYTSSTYAPAASVAYYLPVTVHAPVTVTHILFRVYTQSGNMELGIYNEAFQAVYRQAVADPVPAAGFRSTNITDTDLAPGNYYLSLVTDNTTVRFLSSTNFAYMVMNALGARCQGSVTTGSLPATATPSVLFNGTTPWLAAAYRTTF